MKLGIINLQNSRCNYGAVLQAAALEEFVRRNVTSDVEHINYTPPPAPKKKSSCVEPAQEKLRAVQEVDLDDVKNVEAFEAFRVETLARTKALYSLDELREASRGYDAIVVGSDQVWRLQYTRHTFPAFFLSFAPENCQRVAYAASFGTDQWEGDEQETAEATRCLQKFDAISVREKGGVDVCRDVFGLEASRVLDPVLLIGGEFFGALIDKHALEYAPSDFVYYKLRGASFGFHDVQRIAEESGLSIENIYFKSIPLSSGEKEYHFHSVTEWLGKIRACRRMLITDSFHGICLAILFERDFVWIPNENAGVSRLESLLGDLGLMERKCTDLSEVERFMKTDSSIEYAAVNEKLEKMRAASRDFLLAVWQGAS